MSDDHDLTIAAVAMTCRMSYSSVATAVAEHAAGVRHPSGTLAYTAVMCWRAVVSYNELIADVFGGEEQASRGEII